MNKNLRILIAFATVYLLWGSTYLAIRFAIETLPGFAMAGLRFLIAGGLLYAYSHFKNPTLRPTWKQWGNAAIVGGLLLFGGNGAVVWAEQYVPSGLAALFIATVPWWMVIFECLFYKSDKPSKAVMLGLVIGFMGVAVLIAPAFSGHIHLGGALVLLMAALWWSLGSVYAQRCDLPPAIRAIAMEMIAGGVLLMVVAWFNHEWAGFSLAHASFKSIAAFGYLIVFGSLFGFTAYIWLLYQVGSTLASTYAFVNPMVAVFLGWLLAGEQLTAQSMMAAVLIIAAVVLITFGQSRIKE